MMMIVLKLVISMLVAISDDAIHFDCRCSVIFHLIVVAVVVVVVDQTQKARIVVVIKRRRRVIVVVILLVNNNQLVPVERQMFGRRVQFAHEQELNEQQCDK